MASQTALSSSMSIRLSPCSYLLTRLSHSKDCRQLCLGQFCLYSNATKQTEECLSITLPLSRESSDSAALINRP
jgi:hypothetical protein